VEIMPDKVILYHKKSYLVSFENFYFFQFLAKIGLKIKITKNENFQNRPNMTFYGLIWLYLGSPRKSRDGLRSGNKASQNTFKNTPEDDLDTFCDITSHLTSKYRPDFLGLRKLLDRTGPCKSGLWRKKFILIIYICI